MSHIKIAFVHTKHLISNWLAGVTLCHVHKVIVSFCSHMNQPSALDITFYGRTIRPIPFRRTIIVFTIIANITCHRSLILIFIWNGFHCFETVTAGTLIRNSKAHWTSTRVGPSEGWCLPWLEFDHICMCAQLLLITDNMGYIATAVDEMLKPEIHEKRVCEKGLEFRLREAQNFGKKFSAQRILERHYWIKSLQTLGQTVLFLFLNSHELTQHRTQANWVYSSRFSLICFEIGL